jgi:hypothetical protein
MARTACSPQPALAMVETANGVLTVKKAPRPSNHDGSVRCSGHRSPLRRFPPHPFSVHRRLFLPQRSPSGGGIGRVVAFGGTG